MILTHLEVCKHAIINDLFVRSADENYITARWCAQSGQWTDFAWLAVHTLEKYMKAILLANGRSTLERSHDILQLYADLEQICGNGLVSPNLVRGISTHSNLDVTTFLNGIYHYGNADARYGIFGSSMSWNDLENLDSLVAAFRRLICPLDKKVDGALIESWEVADAAERAKLNEAVPTYRQWLSNHPSEIVGHEHGGHLGEVIKDMHHPLRHAALNCNLALAPRDYDHDWSWRKAGWRESAIDRHILGQLESDDIDSAKLAIDLADWLLANIKVSTGKDRIGKVTISGQKQIDDAVMFAKSKHCLP